MYPDYESKESSYIWGKPAADTPPLFDVSNILTPNQKNSYWYHTELDKQPPGGLVDLHVAKFLCLKLKFLNDKNEIVCCQDTKQLEF